MTKPLRLGVLALVLIGAGCSPSEETQNGDTLRSDIPLRSAQYLFDNPEAAVEVKAMCDQWKASQRPLASWPAVVTENCNNENAARSRRDRRERTEHMKKQMGI
ncbi:hypothetical protein [Sphingobium xenophagum]|uniref:hypothetical protein n=1 Tax=Sphingobium xenophagum TaxID=121428 RepID=UPI0003674AAF|nr:hypothetical protein [Sphingobium xenophagum]